MATMENNNSVPLSTTPPTTNGNDSHSSTLTLRMIMQGKEAGSIIGKKGDNVKKFREDSGAKINISDASCPERIVTVTGLTEQIIKAFTMICRKFEEVGWWSAPEPRDIHALHQQSTLPKPPVTIRLVVPASQCGSLIGKGGSKIKEIREITGASIQVASEMLPNSTERAVTVSGSADSITQCIHHICSVMLESPPKGATIPYRPKPAMPPVIFAGGQAFTVQGQYAMPHHHQHPDMAKVGMQQGLLGQPLPMMAGGQAPMVPAGMQGISVVPQQAFHPRPQNHAHPHPVAHLPNMPQMNPNNAQAHEMTIPNDLIGCIIGRGGSKINEIRQLSGAQIKIANVEEGSSDRKVTITGTPETINAAQYLINASIEMHKQQLLLDPNAAAAAAAAAAVTNPTSMLSGATSTHQATPHPHPPQLASIPTSAPLAFSVSPMIKSMAVGGLPMPMPHMGHMLANQKVLTTKMKGGTTLVQAPLASKNGNKFSPY